MYLRSLIFLKLVLVAWASSDPFIAQGLAKKPSDTIEYVAGHHFLSEKIVYLPLGWPANLACEAATMLDNIHLLRKTPIKWIERNKQFNKVLGNPSQAHSFSNNALQLRAISKAHDGSVFECLVTQHDNTTMASRIRVRVQDCGPNEIGENTSHNLRDPCVYGKCQVVNKDKVECICFRQYTGIVCDKRKDYSVIQEVLPFVLPIVAAIGFGIFAMLSYFFCTRPDKSKEQTMKCADLIGYSYRDTCTLQTLYPFVKKLKKAKYHIREKKDQSTEDTGQDGNDGEDVDDGDEVNTEMSMTGTSASSRGTTTGRTRKVTKKQKAAKRARKLRNTSYQMSKNKKKPSLDTGASTRTRTVTETGTVTQTGTITQTGAVTGTSTQNGTVTQTGTGTGPGTSTQTGGDDTRVRPRGHKGNHRK